MNKYDTQYLYRSTSKKIHGQLTIFCDKHNIKKIKPPTGFDPTLHFFQDSQGTPLFVYKICADDEEICNKREDGVKYGGFLKAFNECPEKLEGELEKIAADHNLEFEKNQHL